MTSNIQSHKKTGCTSGSSVNRDYCN